MKIKEIRVVEIELNPKPLTPPRTPSQASTYPMNRPISRYPTFDKKVEDVFLEWKRPACIVTAEDGTWGFGISLHGGPVTRTHRGLLCPTSCWRKLHGDREIVGHDGTVISRLWRYWLDQLRDQRRSTVPCGTLKAKF